MDIQGFDIYADVTTREALQFLHDMHHLPRRQAEAVLACGLAGSPRPDGRAKRYDARRLLALGMAPELTDDEVWRACPVGVFIARLAAHRGFHVDAPRADHVAAARGPWYVPWPAHLWIRGHAEPDRPFPFIATVGDFVVFGAHITGQSYPEPEIRATNMAGHRTVWELAAPGRWYDQLAGRRLTLGPGYPWKIWGAPVSAPFDRTGLVDDDEISAAAARAARRRGRPRPPGPPACHPPSAARPPGPSA